MNRKDSETERPHFYSQYWIGIARQIGGGALSATAIAPEPSIARPQAKAAIPPVLDDDDLDLLPKPLPRPIKPKPQAVPKTTTLKDLSELAALGIGQDADAGESPFSDDDSPEEVLSKLTKGAAAPSDDLDSLEEIGVEPDEEEAASLESLSDEEAWEDEEEDDIGLGRRPRPIKPSRRPAPRRLPPVRE